MIWLPFKNKDQNLEQFFVLDLTANFSVWESIREGVLVYKYLVKTLPPRLNIPGQVCTRIIKKSIEQNFFCTSCQDYYTHALLKWTVPKESENILCELELEILQLGNFTHYSHLSISWGRGPPL